jgi:hypothetical protein
VNYPSSQFSFFKQPSDTCEYTYTTSAKQTVKKRSFYDFAIFL